MNILSIDTSCDETAVAATNGRRILSNEIYSQILIHKKWGGVVPHLAKRAHKKRIDMVVEEALKKAHIVSIKKEIDYLAVTYGPGLAPALEVGIAKAKELAKKYNKKILPVNHMEGHIYSCFAQNRKGNPKQDFRFPYLALLVSGGHTELVLFKAHIKYEILGETVDDAAGEALDKCAKMLGLGYPGGPIIEKLAETGDKSCHHFPRPMKTSNDLNFSFSGLKTSFYYYLKKLPENKKLHNLNNFAASYQEAVFDCLLYKLEKAIKQTGIKRIIAAGGVMANQYLRKKIRSLIKKYQGEILFPQFKTLYGDNAAMIGIAGYFIAKKERVIENIDTLERVPRLRLGEKAIFY